MTPDLILPLACPRAAVFGGQGLRPTIWNFFNPYKIAKNPPFLKCISYTKKPLGKSRGGFCKTKNRGVATDLYICIEIALSQ